MPIITKEQGSVDYGGSAGRVSPVDTYSRPAPDSGAGDTANQLAQSLARFANVTSGWADERKQEQAEETKLKFDKMVADVERDSANGLSYMAAAQKLYPQESPVLHARLVSAAAKNQVERDLYPKYSELQSDEATLSDPKALQAKIDQIKSEYLANKKGRDDFETSAYIKGVDLWATTIQNEAIKNQATRLYSEGKERWIKDSDPRLMSSQNAVISAAATVGVDPKYTTAILKAYNPNGDPNARNQFQGQTASGLMDITDGTWADLVQKYGAQYGVTYEQKNDPKASALMGAAYAKELYGQITNLKGRPASVGEVNAAYMLGFGGFKNFLDKMEKNPDMPMNELLGERKFDVNAGFFTDRKSGRAITAREAMAKWEGFGSSTTQPVKRFDGVAPFKMDQNSFVSTQGYKWTDFKNDGQYGGAGEIDGRMVNMLDNVTELFGRGKLTITSAVRSDKYDKEVGGKGNHPHGDALDIDVSKLSSEDKQRLISLFVATGARGVGHYSNGTIHVDLGTGRAATGSQTTTDEVRTWAKGFENQPWFTAGIADGKRMREDGSVALAGFNGQPVNAFDLRVREARAGGMTPQVARDALFKTFFEQAKANRDTNMLDLIPDGSITAEQRALKTELQREIPRLILSDIAAKDAGNERLKKQAYISRETEIMERTSKGEILDPDKMATITYKDVDGKDVTVRDDKVFELAKKQNEADRVDDRTSKATAQQMATSIQNAFVTNQAGDNFKDYPSLQRLVDANNGAMPRVEDVRRAILFDPNLNKAERAELYNAIPAMSNLFTLVQSKEFVDSQAPIKAQIDLFMKAGVSKLALEGNSQVASLFSRLGTEVERYQRDMYIRDYQAWHQTHPGQQINPIERNAIIDKVQEKTQKYYDFMVERLKFEALPNGKVKTDEAAAFSKTDPFKPGLTIPEGIPNVPAGMIMASDPTMVAIRTQSGREQIVPRQYLANVTPIRGPEYTYPTMSERPLPPQPLPTVENNPFTQSQAAPLPSELQPITSAFTADGVPPVPAGLTKEGINRARVQSVSVQPQSNPFSGTLEDLVRAVSDVARGKK